MSVARLRWSPKACRAAPRAMATKSWAARLPAEDLDQVARVAGQELQVRPDLGRLGPELLARPAAASAGRRRSGRGPRPPATTAMTMSQTRCELPLRVAGRLVEVQVADGQRQGDEEQRPLHDPAGRAGQHAGAHRHGRGVPLLLEEPDPGGQHGHRSAGQGHEGVGHLEGHGPPVGQRVGHRPTVVTAMAG